MTTQKQTRSTVRCEAVGCIEDAELILSRVDASSDRWYLCSIDAERYDSEPVWEQSKLPLIAELTADKSPLAWTLEVVLAFFPPKHRKLSRRDADEVLAASE